MVCNTSTVEALNEYLTQQGTTIPTELLNSNGTPALANTMISNMVNSNNFVPVTVNQAMDLTNNGAVVIAGLTGIEHGHVDVIGAGGTQPTGMTAFLNQNPRSVGNSQPALELNWNTGGKISYSFSSQPTYYHYSGFTPRQNAIQMPDIIIILPVAINLSRINRLTTGN